MEVIRAIILFFIFFVVTPFFAWAIANDTKDDFEHILLKAYFNWNLFFIISIGIAFFNIDIGNSTTIDYTAGIYCAIVYLFILTPIYIIKYFKTPNYENKDLHYILVFIMFTLTGAIGASIYFNRGKSVEAPWIIFSTFIPFAPIMICRYFGKKGK